MIVVHNPRNKKLYERVRKLRGMGMSYRNIFKLCNVPKSNVSLWCNNIKLTSEQYDVLVKNKKNNLLLGSKYNVNVPKIKTLFRQVFDSVQ